MIAFLPFFSFIAIFLRSIGCLPIGASIVPSASLFQQEATYLDQYRFVNHYGKRIKENGGIPVGILPVDGHAVLPALELCDGIIICGGGRIFPYHFEIEYIFAAYQYRIALIKAE